MKSKRVISVVGLGYVGLPVAVALSEQLPTIGFDTNRKRIADLSEGRDKNGTFSREELLAHTIRFTSEIADLKEANFHIIAVPTPVDDARKPELTPLIRASESVGGILKKGDIVVYESTVFPGATEDICVPILEKLSGLKCGEDFGVGYSPERMNPGDKEHGFAQIKKVVSGNDEATLAVVSEIYGAVVKAGIYKAQSIRVAEAAKVIENTQRDLNIALMNELAIVFDRLNIDSHAVLDAACTKWNFLPFKPGLVGGHCIGVDPYYLTYKAEQVGYHPEVILAGRRINDGMGKFIAQKVIKELIRMGNPVKGRKVSVLGLSFKENVPDIRNTRVIDIIAELKEFGVDVQICDPLVDEKEAKDCYGISLAPLNDIPPADALVLAVPHKEFQELSVSQIQGLLNAPNGIVIDVKACLDKSALTQEGLHYWRL